MSRTKLLALIVPRLCGTANATNELLFPERIDGINRRGFLLPAGLLAGAFSGALAALLPIVAPALPSSLFVPERGPLLAFFSVYDESLNYNYQRDFHPHGRCHVSTYAHCI